MGKSHKEQHATYIFLLFLLLSCPSVWMSIKRNLTLYLTNTFDFQPFTVAEGVCHTHYFLLCNRTLGLWGFFCLYPKHHCYHQVSVQSHTQSKTWILLWRKNTVLVFRALLQKKEPSQHTTGRSSKPFFQIGKGNWETCSTLSAEVEIIVQEFLIPEHCKEHFHVPSHGSNEEHCWLSKSLFPGICSLFPTGLYYFMTLSIFHSFVQGLSGSTCWDFSPSPAAAEQPCPEQPAGTSSSWAHSTPRCQWGSCTRSTTAVGQLGEGNTAHTSLPRQLFVFISEHKPQNTWKQVTWLVYIPQTRAQCGEIPYSGFHLSHGVCKHSAHKY